MRHYLPLGIDHEKLTYHFAGRDFRLTDAHGRVVMKSLPEISNFKARVYLPFSALNLIMCGVCFDKEI